MTEDSLPEIVVATLTGCEQYRFRVSLPTDFDKSLRSGIRKQSLRETGDALLNCTRRYQAIGWSGSGNPAFTDSKLNPSDSKSDFLHLLGCLRMIELSHDHLKSVHAGRPAVFLLVIRAPVPFSTLKGFAKLAEASGLEIRDEMPAANRLPPVQIGGNYRAAQPERPPFQHQPLQQLGRMRLAARRFSAIPLLGPLAGALLRYTALACWPFSFTARALFSVYYRKQVCRILKNPQREKNLHLYVEIRGGKDRDVRHYLRWKYGTEIAGADHGARSIHPFTHLSRPGQAYSLAAMIWARQSLKRMAAAPEEGCVLVNYLIGPGGQLRLRRHRIAERQRVGSLLFAMRDEATTFIEKMIYSEFRSTLHATNAFALEIAACYDAYFSILPPGVVVQADAVAKTARQFTASARHLGGKVIYLADRICTRLRTSNQLITDESANLHFPDHFVIFDQVTRGEFLRQGVAEERIHLYQRAFGGGGGEPSAGEGAERRNQVVVFLQAYVDNIGAMVRTGLEIARRMPELEVVFKEHPSYPVCDRMKAKVSAEIPDRLRFLPSREAPQLSRALAMVTGYSTAAVPGILQGVPLVWLRRQVDNSVYGGEYLGRIGFAADGTEDVISILQLLVQHDPPTLEACSRAREQVAEIFTHPDGVPASSFSEALESAMDDSFRRISAARRPPPP